MPVPDGTTFETGLKATHPSWQIEGRWFRDGANEAVVGAALAAKQSRRIRRRQSDFRWCRKRIGEQCRPRWTSPESFPPAARKTMPCWCRFRSRKDFGSSRTIPAAFRQRADEARRRAGGSRSALADAHGIRPLVLLAVHFLDQLPDRAGAAGNGRARHSPRGGYRRAHSVAVSTLLWIVTLAALIAAALAVAATSAATVLERRVEIGIMKAIGATNIHGDGLFLAEQLMLAMAGGAIGFVLGAGLARVLGSERLRHAGGSARRFVCRSCWGLRRWSRCWAA